MKLQLPSQVFIELMFCVVFVITCNAQIKIHNQSDLTKRQQEIIQVLLLDNYPHEQNLKKFKRSEVVKALKVAQRFTSGADSANYAYLLAYMRENYAGNKARLIEIANSCVKYKPKDINYECTENAAWFLHKLYLRGDNSIVQPLFHWAKGSDAALSEGLGTAYAEIVSKDPILFLQTLKAFKLQDQIHIIDFAIRQDGSCNPSCLPLKTRKFLIAISKNLRHPLQKFAALFVSVMNDPNQKYSK